MHQGGNHHWYRRQPQGTAPPVIPADPVASLHLWPQSLQTFPDAIVPAVSEVRWCPTAQRYHSPCTAEVTKMLKNLPVQYRSCWSQIPVQQKLWVTPEPRTSPVKTKESSSDPAVRAAPLALLMFMQFLPDCTTCHTCYKAVLQRDRGINPNIYQVMQEARTSTAPEVTLS